MWFCFPEGVSSISVELQQFASEVEEEVGGKVRSFFRAPDHFAAKILDLPGFVAAEPTSTDLEDLPRADPLRDGALSELSSKIEALKLENEGLKSVNAELRAERDDLKLKLIEAETKLNNLRETGNEDGQSGVLETVSNARRK